MVAGYLHMGHSYAPKGRCQGGIEGGSGLEKQEICWYNQTYYQRKASCLWAERTPKHIGRRTRTIWKSIETMELDEPILYVLRGRSDASGGASEPKAFEWKYIDLEWGNKLWPKWRICLHWQRIFGGTGTRNEERATVEWGSSVVGYAKCVSCYQKAHWQAGLFCLGGAKGEI